MRTVEQKEIDTNELWLDPDVSGEELVQLDPLDITADMVKMAEQPELTDFAIHGLPEQARV